MRPMGNGLARRPTLLLSVDHSQAQAGADFWILESAIPKEPSFAVGSPEVGSRGPVLRVCGSSTDNNKKPRTYRTGPRYLASGPSRLN